MPRKMLSHKKSCRYKHYYSLWRLSHPFLQFRLPRSPQPPIKISVPNSNPPDPILGIGRSPDASPPAPRSPCACSAGEASSATPAAGAASPRLGVWFHRRQLRRGRLHQVLRVPVRGGRGHRVGAPHRVRPPRHRGRVPPPPAPRAPPLPADRHVLWSVVRAAVPRPRQRARGRHVRGPRSALTLRLLMIGPAHASCLIIFPGVFWFTFGA